MVKKIDPKKGGLSGIDEVMKNLNTEISKMKDRTMKGIILAGIHIRRDMEDTFPKIPVDLGNLRASWFTVTTTGTSETKGGGFKGEEAGKMKEDHSKVIGESKATIMGKKDPQMILGFTANYAMWVHENVDAQFFGRGGKKPGRPESGAKFFEAHLDKNYKKILEIIAANTKIQ